MSDSWDCTELTGADKISDLLILDPLEFRRCFVPELDSRKKILAERTRKDSVSSFDTLMDDSLWAPDRHHYTELIRLGLALHLFWTYTRTKESVSQVHEKIEPLRQLIKTLIVQRQSINPEVEKLVDSWYQEFEPLISQLNNLRSSHQNGVISTIPGMPVTASLHRRDASRLSGLDVQQTVDQPE